VPNLKDATAEPSRGGMLELPSDAPANSGNEVVGVSDAGVETSVTPAEIATDVGK